MKKLCNLLFFISILCTHFATYTKDSKVALIFGVTGQDGSYLAEFLLEKGYTVHGVKRRSSSFNTDRVDHLYSDLHEYGEHKFILHYGDLTDAANVTMLIAQIRPDEIYNLAAQSHVRVSFDVPEYTALTDGLGTLHILEALRRLDLFKRTKFYQASTSEMFGKVLEIPQKETTPFNPQSPYAVAKVYAYWITRNYRDAFGIFAVNGILFNHESPRRGETFVTRKITRAVAAIKLGIQDKIYLGNLDSIRDWGYAKDYVEAMWLMLQQDKPHDLVIATGETHSVREFVELAFAHVGITIAWRGSGIDEVGYDVETGNEYIFIDPLYFRPTEVDYLQGDASRAFKLLNWKPKTSLKTLVELMVESDLKHVARGR